MVRAARLVLSLVFVLSPVLVTQAADKNASEPMNSLRRDQALQMLKDVHDKVAKEYYDPAFHGMDFEGRYKEATQRITKATSFSDAMGVIAWYLDALNDSHTIFLPPPRPYLVQDGWEAFFIGDNCYIIAVKNGSDAAKKGLKPGDQVLAIEGYRPTRDNWRKLNYAFHLLSPRSGMTLVVASPGEQPRQLVVMAQVNDLPQHYNTLNFFLLGEQLAGEEERNLPRFAEKDDVLIWKLPAFLVSDDYIDNFLKRANNHKSVIIDLRGNPGGAEENLDRLLGGFFDHEVKVGDRTERKDSKPFVVKSRGSHAYSGKLIVLVDSRSASAAELFARVVQLEKRGTVIGDRSSGAVMEAREFSLHQGEMLGSLLPYGVEITVADLKMTDGKSLEHTGVVPDEILLPSPEELAAGADPQLARALQLVGVPMSSAAAGQIFPTQWR